MNLETHTNIHTQTYFETWIKTKIVEAGKMTKYRNLASPFLDRDQQLDSYPQIKKTLEDL